MKILLASLPLALLAATPSAAKEPAIHSAVTSDPAPDAAYPAGMDAFPIPVEDGALNAVMYTAAGAGRHPALLLLHGFPGNEQHLDLAQAARRAGWHVLTLHYRGSWGSPGSFSFGNAARDAYEAVLFLSRPETVAKYRIDPSAIVVAGASMGGFMAADAAASEPRVAGLFLIDPWDPGDTGKTLGTPEGLAAWRARVDLAPLSGTSFDALAGELRAGTQRFDLGQRLAAYARRPLTIIGAERGLAKTARAVSADAQAVNPDARLTVWASDHNFNDKRIALADALVRFLKGIAPMAR